MHPCPFGEYKRDLDLKIRLLANGFAIASRGLVPQLARGVD